ncbi:MAG: 16S rRNA (cytidine(1402)-2'-O)-methyltransferase [Oscillospiraceae bacterium]|jgi:16S rRNA (cytidine1402-2'-O)-methyltransferase|nr:16S rRNA (cytidine(1402)-2'-O)-methyltransferase [Oscillospiraceae bacterium]
MSSHEAKQGTLTLVATPIGNLGDISARALEALSAADFIACEDTRVSLKLLTHFGIKKPLVSYYEHNKEYSGRAIITRVLAGENCVLVSDAGNPCVSDPGAELVASAREAGIAVSAVPGASAVITAVALSGLPGRFCFEGFLSVNKRTRRSHLAELREETRTMVFYEAPHKLLRTLADFQETFGDRKVVICRELTKKFEEVIATTVSAAIERYTQAAPKGEFVLVVSGKPSEKAGADDSDPAAALLEAAALAKRLISEGTAPAAAAKEAAKRFQADRQAVYRQITGK